MRLAVLSDTHGRPVPEACAERLRAADLVLHAGDVGTEAALEGLRALAPGIVAVRGNVDRAGLGLPERQEVDAGGVRIGLVHDAGPAKGRLARLRERFPGCDVVVFGHSHVPLLEQEDGFTILNPGSATQRRRQPRHTMVEGTVEGGRPSFAFVDLD